MSTINDSRMKLERMLAVVLPAFLPQAEGCAVEVDIIEDGLKMHSGAGSESWRPYNGGEIRIRFVAAPATATAPAVGERSPFPLEDDFGDRGAVRQSRSDLIRSLQRAGRREGFEFVSLKWFRDLFLPAEQYVWSDSLEARSGEIGDAIDDGAILTYKVPNTRSPEFPVTAIRLNLAHPDVIATVGEAPPRPSGFQPVGIRGQHLSSTLMQERR